MKILRHQNIEGMARVGFTSDTYEVYVNTDDGGKRLTKLLYQL